MKRLHLACALFLLGLVVPPARGGALPADVPSLGNSAPGMDRSLDLDEITRRAAVEKLVWLGIPVGYPADVLVRPATKHAGSPYRAGTGAGGDLTGVPAP